jgi:hypothetical protein
MLEKRAAQGRRKRLKGRAGMERLVDWDEDPPAPLPTVAPTSVPTVHSLPPYCCPYPCPYCTLTPSLLLPLPVSLLYTHSLGLYALQDLIEASKKKVGLPPCHSPNPWPHGAPDQPGLPGLGEPRSPYPAKAPPLFWS